MGNSRDILPTGLRQRFNDLGQPIDCRGTGQDAEWKPGIVWPAERFETISNHLIRDRATDLIWTKNSCLSEFTLTWQEGLDFAEQMNRQERYGRTNWRMPNPRFVQSEVGTLDVLTGLIWHTNARLGNPSASWMRSTCRSRCIFQGIKSALANADNQ